VPDVVVGQLDVFFRREVQALPRSGRKTPDQPVVVAAGEEEAHAWVQALTTGQERNNVGRAAVLQGLVERVDQGHHLRSGPQT